MDNGEALAEKMKQAMIEFFKRYDKMAPEAIAGERYERFRHF